MYKRSKHIITSNATETKKSLNKESLETVTVTFCQTFNVQLNSMLVK